MICQLVLEYFQLQLQKKLTHHEKMPAFFLSLVPYHIDAHSSMILYICEMIYLTGSENSTL